MGTNVLLRNFGVNFFLTIANIVYAVLSIEQYWWACLIKLYRLSLARLVLRVTKHYTTYYSIDILAYTRKGENKNKIKFMKFFHYFCKKGIFLCKKGIIII